MAVATQSVNSAGKQGFSLTRSLKAKLLALFLALSLIPLIAVGVLAFVRSQDALRAAIIDRVEAQRDLLDVAIETFASERVNEMTIMAGMARVQSMDPERALEAINQYYNELRVYETMILTGMDGNSILATDNVAYQLFDRAYMQQALRGQAVVSDPVISRATGQPIIVVASPVISEGRQVGVLLGTLPLNTLDAILKLAWTGQTGDTYLLNPEGYVFGALRVADEVKSRGIVRERVELEFKPNTHGVREAVAGRTGVDSYANFRGDQVTGAYTGVSVPGTQWGLVVTQEDSEAFAEVVALRNIILIIGLIAAALVAFIAFWVARSIADPVVAVTTIAHGLALGDIEQAVNVSSNDEIGQLADAFRQMISYQHEMAGAADRIADGDLTAEVTPQSERDALGNSFVQMIANLRHSMGQVRANALNLASASEQISASAEQSAQASQQVAATIQQVAQGTSQQTEAVTQATFQTEQMAAAIDGIAKGAQEQARAVEGASRVVENMSAMIAQVSANARSSAEASNEAARSAENGAVTVNGTVEAMSTIRTRVTGVGVKVRQMEEQSAQIGAIVETIDDIAEQTNLLALNAAIEAARAGEQGRGFAVVADEVRKLAERSGQATKEIANLIQTVQGNIADAVQAMEASLEQVETGSVRAGEAGDALQQILSAAQAVNRQVVEIASAAQNMTSASEELASSMESVSAIVEENTASAEESAASTGEITSAMENIASVSEENSASAEEVSAMTEEMSAQSEEVTAAAQSLADMARQLQEIVSQFTLPEMEQTSRPASQAAAGAQARNTRPIHRPAFEIEAGNGNGHRVPAHVAHNGNGRK
jgi:methyl-accepting chemotaxis protein